MITICMADNQRVIAIMVNAVYIKGHYNVIIDYMGGHLYDYHLYEWSSVHRQSSYLYVRKSEYVGYLTLFFFTTQKLFLLYFSSAQINHLYDV